MSDNFLTRDVTEAKDGLVVYKSSYWLCENGDATKALFFGDSPQCNQNKAVIEWSLKREYLPKRFTEVKMVFIETAFVPRRKD